MDQLEALKEKIAALSKRAQAAIDSGSKDELEKTMAELRDVRKQADAVIELRAAVAAYAGAPKPQAPAEEPRSIGSNLRRAMLRAATEMRPVLIKGGDPEERAISSNGVGINTVGGIVRALVDGGKLGGLVSKFIGANSQTIVPVFAPHLAVPVGTVEGATGTASDSTAVLGPKALTLKPYYATLPISMGAIMETDIDAELPAIFAEAFGQAVDTQIIAGAGSGNAGLGLFVASASGVTVSQDIACTSGAATAPNWADYLALALSLLGNMNGPIESAAIIVNPTIFKAALGAAASGYDPMKIEYLTRGTILGIKVILSSYALATLTTGSYVAVAGYMRHYAWAYAKEIQIDPIKTVGSDNVTFQAFMYMQFNPLVSTSFYRLKTA